MALLEPLWISEGAWEALREQVIAPEATRAEQDVRELLETWDAPQREADRVGVFIDAEHARTLARLLDSHPALAAQLLG
ncbi:hypothetical protein DSM104299_01510 [Baekduia alba]|uniref:hypothetical protein n=1 Tax=Baekduia alba TaxID=2997333 RepID=UPI002340E7C3|nr:hypothetical protein [Baekduia alba]WCB92810.1 hypothetical protein DSM104299_01510 [Baekduia alba]